MVHVTARADGVGVWHRYLDLIKLDALQRNPPQVNKKQLNVRAITAHLQRKRQHRGTLALGQSQVPPRDDFVLPRTSPTSGRVSLSPTSGVGAANDAFIRAHGTESMRFTQADLNGSAGNPDGVGSAGRASPPSLYGQPSPVPNAVAAGGGSMHVANLAGAFVDVHVTSWPPGAARTSTKAAPRRSNSPDPARPTRSSQRVHGKVYGQSQERGEPTCRRCAGAGCKHRSASNRHLLALRKPQPPRPKTQIGEFAWVDEPDPLHLWVDPNVTTKSSMPGEVRASAGGGLVTALQCLTIPTTGGLAACRRRAA